MARDHHDRPVRDEQQALRRIHELCDPSVGDDAAVVRAGSDGLCISTDATVQGVHAPLAMPARALGRRAAARAISDLAAMGALPRAMTCSVLVPPDGWTDAVDAVAGVAERGREQGMPLVGGDLCRTPGPLGLVVTVVGRRGAPRASAFITRAGAHVGDLVVVTGQLGAASSGHGDHAGDRAALLPEPPDRLRAGAALARHVSAMTDISDGIARDAANLAEASGVGIEIAIRELPLAPGIDDPVAAATYGDDYELLATVAPERHDALRSSLRDADPTLGLTVVGRCVDGDPVARFLCDGSQVELPPGFLHR
ncbi:MAG: thiamine-phosphate kinase [Thermoleophilia bacterium]|nr:thiamine-phosphate kinase [Thermoleophilia bacterium]